MDYAAFAPPPESVKKKILEALDVVGHPLSPHGGGSAAAQLLDDAREAVAALVNASPEEVVFTSGATESNNSAVFGIASANERKGRRIVMSSVEHISVFDAASRLSRNGWALEFVPVGENGVIDLDAFAKALDDKTALACLTAASDENGVLQPTTEAAALCAKRGAHLHVDAALAAGHVPIDFAASGFASMTISGPAIYAPSGVGALVVKNGVRFAPHVIGGGGEDGRRGGSPNLIGIAGLGAAAKLCSERMATLEPNIAGLRDKLIAGVLAKIPGARLIGDAKMRLPGHAAFVIPDAEGEALARELDLQGVRVSSGGLCARWALKPSRVLTAMGIAPELSRNVIMFSLGDGNDSAQVETVLAMLPDVVESVRKIG